MVRKRNIREDPETTTFSKMADPKCRVLMAVFRGHGQHFVDQELAVRNMSVCRKRGSRYRGTGSEDLA